MKSKALYPSLPLLIVDDDHDFLQSIEIALKSNGIKNLHLIRDPHQVQPYLKENKVMAVLLDLTMPHLSGEKVLSLIKEDYPDLPVIILTAINEVDVAVTCIKLGAYDYLIKPVNENRLIITLQNAFEKRELQLENQMLRDSFLHGELNDPKPFKPIVTQSKNMRSLFKYMERVATTPQPVLITGETGSGKELFAQAMHELSHREGQYVTVNVAGLDDNVFSDTLFGHKKGAFTGANTDRDGLIAKADGGSIFLDEIGDLAPSSQVKLLRLIQDREYYPLGSDKAMKSDARLIFATNISLQELSKRKNFRTDLYFRLRAHHIPIPSLRERKEDLTLLLEHFFSITAQSLNITVPPIPRGLVPLLNHYSFPGNVRELQSMVFDAISSKQSQKLSLEVFKSWVGGNEEIKSEEDINLEFKENNILFTGERLPPFKQFTHALYEEALRRADNNHSVAAKILGVSRQTLYRQLKYPPTATERGEF